MITDVLVLLLMFDTASTGYIVKCPDPSQWRPRATSFCDSQLSYVCLLNLLTKHYQEECTGIDYSKIGSKLVFQPVFNLAYCNANRYQPFPFTTHGNTECIYSKSKCHGEGQLVFKNGNESSDTTCLCDYKRRYSFVTQPKNKCFCIPIEEDCSCYRVRCQKLSADYKCIRQDEMFLKNTCEEITRHMQNNKTSTMTNNVLIIQSAVGLSYPDLTIIKIAITVVIAITLTVISLCIMQTFYFEDKKNVMKSKQHFRELILNDKRIKHNYVRVMFIGKHGVGKTSLMRRLLWTKKKDIQKQKSTDGIDISKCIINMQDGKWKPCDDTDNDLAMLIKQVYTKKQGSVVAKRNTNETSKIRRSKNSSVQKLKKDDYDNIPTNDIDNHQEIFDKENKSEEKHANDLDYSKDDTFDENKKPYEEIKQKDDDATDQTNQLIAGQDDNNSKPCEITGDESDYSASTSADSSVHRKLNSAKIEKLAKKKEHEKNLSKITAEIMEQFFKQSDITEPLETFASCWLWDFAGQKDFYATHQAFLSSCAIYVLVADSLEFSTTPALWLDFEKSADYARFWCDAIHCYRSITTDKEELNPAIIIVQTNKDSHKVKPKTEGAHTVFKKNIGNVFANQDQKKHIRKIYHISNTEDDDKVFEEIRQFISHLAMDMSWGSDIPLKWLLFQQVIEKLKENSVPVDSTENILHIANQDDIGIKDETEFRECLQYFHEIGTIIFFDEVGLNESIILDPQWLVEAFKCLVSDKFENTITISNDWNMLRETGKLSDTLLCKLLKKDTFYQTHFLDNKSHLIAVMKKFDIIVNMKNSEDLYMPCMMEDCSLEMVTRKFIDESSNIDKTSWLCLTFDFLPPVFFNHIIARYMKKYDISVKTNEIDRSRRHELYRQVAVFKLTETGCEQLVMCTAPHIIAIQIWYSSGEHKKIYSECRQNLCKMVQSLKTRYRLNIEQSIEFVCKNGHFTLDRTSWKELNGSKYRCQQHKNDHFSLGLVDCWYTEDEMDIERQNLDNDGSDLNFKTVKRKIVKRNRRMRFVGAIHIGASSSLYAYSDIQSNESSMDRTKIKLNKYWCKSTGSNLCSMNTTTSILLRNGNEYVDFGFDAEEKYNNLDASKIYNYNLLNKFTTQLNHKQKISEDFQIRDVKGNNVQASIVFSQMINKLKERLENEVKCDDGKFNPTQMQWVLPIPSTWIDSRAEHFIRTCAKQAGINGDQLILITETEAAVAYLDNSQNYVFRDNRLPTKYLYIDLGDTSYNFTLVETLSKGNIKEVCYLPNKNDSTMGIHMKLFSCFKEIVGSVVLKNLKESSYLKIIEEFENIDTSKENKNIILKIPEKEINDLCIEFHKKNFSQLIEESEYVHAITARNGRLVIKVSFFNMLLKDVAFWITQTVSKVLRKDGDIRTFIVVGGISITRIIRTKLKDNFKTVNIIFLTDYDTSSVVKGAVLYGQGLVT